MGEIQAMHQQSGGVATILAIGTANPLHCVIQADYPDFYFRVTNSEDKTMLKHKLDRICKNSMIKTRHVHMTEETLKQNPNLCTYDEHPSFNARQDIIISETPKLAERAAAAAIEEWGRPKSDITHLIIHSTSGVDMPGADVKLVNSLGLARSVRRLMLYGIGCFAGATVLRLAKDIAENDPSARVLAVCVEVVAEAAFRGPSDADMVCLVGQAIFGDGAAAVVVASDAALISGEAPVFRVVAARETLLPGTEEALTAHCREEGLTFHLSPEVPRIVGENVEACLAEAFEPLGVAGGGDWNSLFWVPHPGGAAILRAIEARVGLEKEKFRATWSVMRDHGNMSSCTVLFILDEMRKWSAKEGKSTTGEGLEWGVLFGFGAGVTIETVVLQSVPISKLFTTENLAAK